MSSVTQRFTRCLFCSSLVVLLTTVAGCLFSGDLTDPRDSGLDSDSRPATDGGKDSKVKTDSEAMTDSGAACTPVADALLCQTFGKDCGDFDTIDNCQRPIAINCGSCALPETCSGGGVPNVCGQSGSCTPESDGDFCRRFGKDCGTFSEVDRCGAARTVSCGSCTLPDTCGGGGADNVCGSPGCTPESDALFCTRQGKNCGTLSATDNCGVTRTVSCGSCTLPETCGGGGADNVCGSPGCIPESDATFCARYGKDCGTFTATDNCGSSRTASCGTCAVPESCGGGGTANVCGCVAENNATFCSRQSKECDVFTGADNCGDTRTVYCGSCVYPETCGGSGTANICGCTPQSNAAFCQAQGVECGPASGQDNCGVYRSVSNCGSCSPGLCINSVCFCPGVTVAATLRPGSTSDALHFTARGTYYWKQGHGYPFEQWDPPVSTSDWRCWGGETVVAAFLWPAGSPLSWQSASSIIIVTSGGSKFYQVNWTTKSCSTTARPAGLPSTGMVAAFNTHKTDSTAARVTFMYSNNTYYSYNYATAALEGPSSSSDSAWPSGSRLAATYVVPFSTTKPLYVVLDSGAKYKTYDFAKDFDPANPLANWSPEYSYQGGPSACSP